MKQQEIIKFGGMEIDFCLDALDTKGALTMFKCVISAGAKIAAAHYHENFDETVYGLKGVATYTVDGKTIELRPGDSLFIPRGTVHAFANRSDETIEFLCMASPGVFGPDYFKDVAEVINAGGPPDMAKLKQAMLNHGLVPVAG
ncbi:MAG TPA: cupin domain-containing protein [Bacteroidia bacterium]|jgi:quercetin dioxygenase-like cupin family protein|nr:cupin domain-containing protein [Bacteroidia bacterium]